MTALEAAHADAVARLVASTADDAPYAERDLRWAVADIIGVSADDDRVDRAISATLDDGRVRVWVTRGGGVLFEPAPPRLRAVA